MIKSIPRWLTIFLLLIAPAQSYSQVSFSQNHPELRWQIFETDHFKIIYHQGIETIADEVASVAEEVYEPITTDLGVAPPQKTPIMVTDYLDYSNGLSTPLGHHIVIWAQSETKYMTGRIKWLRAVVAHEFTHTVVFWGMRACPGFWRELIALGFIPTWFLEGVAEYEAEKWCDHRDMLLRVVSYQHQLLPYKKMTGFIGTDEIGSRLVYEQGHSLIHYLTHNFGRDKIKVLIQKYRSLPISFNLALKRTIGMSEKALFSAWKQEIEAHYHHRYYEHSPVTKTGERLTTPFQGNYSARWSPDGKKIAIVGIKKYNEGVPELYLSDASSKKIKKIAGPYVNSFFSWSPDGTFIVYSQKHVVKTGAYINDLFLLNAQTLQIKKLTDHERATDPHFSPDGQHIGYVIHQESRSNLAILDLTSGEKQLITNFPAWTEVFTPHWSPDGKKIAFSIHDNQGLRDIGLINTDSREWQRLTETIEDDRYPVWSPDGSKIAFISYRNGIPNLYLMELADGAIQQITDTPGGVFNPTWLPDGKHIAVVVFENRAATDIVILPVGQSIRDITQKNKTEWLPFHRSPDLTPIQSGSPLSQHRTHSFSNNYHSLSYLCSQILLPYYGKDEKGWQPGLIHLAADPLGKHTLLTSLSYRSRPHFSINYMNQQFSPAIEITINKTTIDHGDFLRVIYKDGTSVFLPLYENFWSGAVTLYWDINFGRSLLANHLLWLGSAMTYRNIINASEYEGLDTNSWAYPLLQGWINYLTIGYGWQTYRPDVSYDIHPKSGHSFSIFLRHSATWMKSALEFSQLGSAGIWRYELPFFEHVVALRTGLSFRSGKQPAQNRLAIDDNTMRGLSFSEEGDQQFYTNLEYRFPLIKDPGLKLWIIYFEQFCGALFFDSGKAWGSYLEKTDYVRKRRFNTVPFLYTTGLELRHRLYIFGKIPFVLNMGYAFDLSQTRKASLYLRIGSVF